MIELRLAFLNVIVIFIWIKWGSTHAVWVIATTILIGVLGVFSYRNIAKNRNKVLVKLEAGLINIRDGNFAVSLNEQGDKKSQQLISLFNSLIETLRKERQFLLQRELLLDKMMNNTSVAMLIVDQRGNVSFANQTCSKVFTDNKPICGESWDILIEKYFPSITSELATHQGSLIHIENTHTNNNIWHVSLQKMTLQGVSHRLYTFKPVTEEIMREELKTWKKAISVINHELNNSIAPISTMCHNGKLLVSKLNEPYLDKVFSTISSRIEHLAKFVKNYSDFTSQRAPQRQSLYIDELLANLMPLYPFSKARAWDHTQLDGDASQLEQVFINLLKNAQEASPKADISVSIEEFGYDKVKVSIEDNGPGIPDSMINEVMLPFRTTKPKGTGIGLVVCKQIVDAHGGQLSLNNKPNNTGLRVKVTLPR